VKQVVPLRPPLERGAKLTDNAIHMSLTTRNWPLCLLHIGLQGTDEGWDLNTHDALTKAAEMRVDDSTSHREPLIDGYRSLAVYHKGPRPQVPYLFKLPDALEPAIGRPIQHRQHPAIAQNRGLVSLVLNTTSLPCVKNLVKHSLANRAVRVGK
jgi:hypothetical protein